MEGSGPVKTGPIVSALPIFPGRHQPSIFGASELNCRVRDGNGWTLTAISTDFVRVDFATLLFQPFSRLKPIELKNGDPWESRTPVCGVRGRRLDHLTNGPSSRQAPYHSLSPAAKARSLRCLSSPNKTQVILLGPQVPLLFGVSLLGASHPRGSGTPSGTRTLDTLIKSQVLYQLS